MASSIHAVGNLDAQQLVDLTHLARQTLGNPDLEQEILRLFQTQSAIYAKKVACAPDRESCQEAAHTLKGSAKGIGAWLVAEAAERVEDARGDRQKRIVNLQAAIDATRSYISSLLVAA